MSHEQTFEKKHVVVRSAAVIMMGSLAVGLASDQFNHHPSEQESKQHPSLSAVDHNRQPSRVSRTMTRPDLFLSVEDDAIVSVKSRLEQSGPEPQSKVPEPEPERFWFGSRNDLRILQQEGTLENAAEAYDLSKHEPWFSLGEVACLDTLWFKESKFDERADNPTSSAYGIPQALPGSKMASAGEDWRESATTQMEWGLDYITNRYGSACDALDHSRQNGWY